MAANDAGLALQRRAAAIEREVTALRERVEAAREAHAEREAELASQPVLPGRSWPTAMGIVALLMLAPLGVLVLVVWNRATVDRGCAPPFPTHSPERTTSDVFEARLAAVVTSSSGDGARKVGDRCVVRLVGRDYRRETEVEHVSLSCASGQDGTYALVYDSAVDGDPRGPSRRILADRAKYEVNVTTRPPEVAYTETWNSPGGSGGAEIATTTHRARFHVETPDEPDREWLVDLTDAPDKPKGAP